MANSLAVMFQRNMVKEPLPHNKSQEMPAHSPEDAAYMPGEKTKRGARRGMRFRGHKGKKKSNARAVMGA